MKSPDLSVGAPAPRSAAASVGGEELAKAERSLSAQDRPFDVAQGQRFREATVRAWCDLPVSDQA